MMTASKFGIGQQVRHKLLGYLGKKQPITGYVWNRDDGSVGVKAFAEENALKEFEDWLEAGGPRSANITIVMVI